MNIPGQFGIITIATEVADSGAPQVLVSADTCYKSLFGKKGKVVKISICNIWSICNAGCSGLKWRDTIHDSRFTRYEVRKITYEKIKLFMQNEPNFTKSQVNVTFLITRNYEQMDTWSNGKNEPKTNPNEPKTNPIQTQFYHPKQPNLPNFKGKKILSVIININEFTTRNERGDYRANLPKPDCFCYLCRLQLLMMDRRIIINADDFGLSDGVNEAVAQAHTDGILTSATIIANMPAAEEAVKIAKRLPTLGIGVHLNLTEGRPILKNTSINRLLDADGRFAYSPFIISLLSLAGHKIREAIRAELAAQIQWVIDHGLKPTHLDSHKHFHAFPALFSIVCQLARQFGIPAVRWPFEPKELLRPPWPLTSKDGRKRAKKIRIMARINRMQNQDFLKNDAVLGIAHTGKIDVNFFKAVSLYSPAATAEVMTHPGFVDGLNPDKTRLLHQREVELEALCNEKTKQYFEDAGIKLVHYGKL